MISLLLISVLSTLCTSPFTLLKVYIQAAVLMQCPQDLDTTIVLAQLQDEVATLSRRKDAKKPGFS